LTYNTRYCNNPHHSRPATQEEAKADILRRTSLVDAAHEHGEYSDKQWETARRALEVFKGYPRCTLPPNFLSPGVEDFWSSVHEERQRQKEIGFDEDHDREHGPLHLIEVAQLYIWRGEMTKAAAVLEAWKDLLKETTQAGHPEIDPEGGDSSFPIKDSSWPLQGDE